jgi:putative aldouronate transport system substrate-binding protein
MKKIVSLLLTLVMVMGLVSLAGAETAQTLEPVTLKIWFHGSNVKDDAAVMEKVNEYLKEKLNVTLQPIWGTWGDFDSNVVMSLNAGDDVDMYFTCSWSQDDYAAYAKKGNWVRLDDPANNLIEKYAPDLFKTLPEVLRQGATIEGASGLGIYAVPGYKDFATQNTWDINVDLLTKYGYTLDDIKNTDYYGFGDILKKVKEGEGADFYPLCIEPAVLERMVTNSVVVTGDSSSLNVLSFYLDPTKPSNDSPNGNVIYNKFATPEFKKFAEKTREYYQAGYIDPAMASTGTSNDARQAAQLAGRYLIGTQSYALGYEVQASGERNIQVQFVPTTPAFVDTTASQGAMFAISTASKNPERSMMFLNLLNTDPYLMTLLNYGVEGIHYEKTADGLVRFLPKRDDYQPWRNGMGNITLLPPQEGEGVGFWDTFKAYYGGAESTPILGFIFNQEPVSTEMAAIANVAAEYGFALEAGAIDPAEKIPEFLTKLDEAGMQKVVDEANAQLQAFLAAKK